MGRRRRASVRGRASEANEHLLGEDPWETAFRRHYGDLVRLCFLLSGSQSTAEDIVQEAFVRAAPVIHRLGDDEVRSYLRRAVLDLWKNQMRRSAIERRLFSRRLPWDKGQGAHPDTVGERSAIWQALIRLSRRQRACLVLRYYEDLSEAEIARILRCSVGSVKTHVSRGLRNLRKEVER